MTSKPPILSVQPTANNVRFVNPDAAAKALIAYNLDVARCAGNGYAPHPPQIEVIIKDLTRERKVIVRAGTAIGVVTTPLGIKLTFELIEYGDLKKQQQPHKRGNAVVMSERPDYDQVPDDTGD